MPVEKSGDTFEYKNGRGDGREATGVVLMGASILLTPAAAKTISVSGSSSNQTISTGTRAISIYARGGDLYYIVGNDTQTATTSGHYLAAGERIDISVSGFASPNIAAIMGPGGASATLHISEMV